jgi:hypothetical protein
MKRVTTRTFWIAGFECSCHRRSDGRRLDLIAATRHDRFAAEDYARLHRFGIATARDGARWPAIERTPGRYDVSGFLPMVRAARDTGVQVIWDLCHYGWPEGLDVFRPAFVDRFARFAREMARVVAAETDEPPFWCPVNEMSFWSWAGGDVAYMNPFATGRGFELKTQLARAALAAAAELRAVDRRARFLYAEPSIHITHDPERPEQAAEAEGHRLAQFQAWDMVAGRLWPQLGGEESSLDVIGLNFYPPNQWIHGGPPLPRGHRLYRPFREILIETWQRYRRPMLIAETGAPGDERAPWLRYITGEVIAAWHAGVPVEGVCLYPILDYPGWDDDRHCATGLWGEADAAGERPLCHDLARELERQSLRLRREREPLTSSTSLIEQEETEHVVV